MEPVLKFPHYYGYDCLRYPGDLNINELLTVNYLVNTNLLSRALSK